MPSVRIPNTAASYTAPCPSCAKKVSRAYTEVYSPSYVYFYLYLCRLDACFSSDDATRRQFGSSLHDLYHPQAVRSVHRTSGSTAPNWNYVCDWCDCRPRDRLCHATTRVRSIIFVLIRVFDMWDSVIKTRMQSLSAPREYKNSFHCGYRILTEEGLFRFWTGTTPRLARLVVSSQLVCQFIQEMTIADEWWDRLYGIRKHHQSHWRKSIESLSLDGTSTLSSVALLSIPFDQYLGQRRQFCPLTLFQFCHPFTRGFCSLDRINKGLCRLLCLR